VQSAKSIIVTSHMSPDEDSIGSVLTLYDLLTHSETAKEEKSIRLLYSGTRLPRFEGLANYDRVEFVTDMAEEITDSDLVILLDAGALRRASKQPEVLDNFKGRKICIDHHRTEGEAFDLSLVDPDCPATAELIYRIFYQDREPTLEAAEAMLVGILGDTGNFAYLKPTQMGTFDVVKRLLPFAKTSIQELQSRYRGITPKALAGIKHLLSTMRLHKLPGWSPFQSTVFTREFAEENNYSDEEVSEATHTYPYLTSMEGYKWGLVLGPRGDGGVRIGLRSRTSEMNVRRIMERMGLGGGHDQAAGGTIIAKPGEKLDPQAGLEQILTWLKRNKPE